MESLTSLITGLIMTATATSMTGGVQAGAGEYVVTGDSYSSASVQTIINADDSGGTSHTIIKTSVDGKEQVEERTETIPAGSSVYIHVATSSVSKGVVIESSLASSTPHEGGEKAAEIAPRITEKITSFFALLFSWFSFIW